MRGVYLTMTAAALLALTACTTDAAGGARPAASPAGAGLRAPATLDELPRVEDFGAGNTDVPERQPGIARVVAGYGQYGDAALVLEAYAGSAADMKPVHRALESRLRGSVVPAASCHPVDERVRSCWRSTETKVVLVTARDGRPLDDLVLTMEEAWRSS